MLNEKNALSKSSTVFSEGKQQKNHLICCFFTLELFHEGSGLLMQVAVVISTRVLFTIDSGDFYAIEVCFCGLCADPWLGVGFGLAKTHQGTRCKSRFAKFLFAS